MSLTASERRALTTIERVLQSRDPRLRSLFSTFTRLTRQEAMPAREQLPPRRHRRPPRAVIVVPIAVALIGVIIVLGSLGAAGRACRPAAASQPAASAGVSGAARACPPPREITSR
jgi:hypothetical protein